MDFIKAKNLFTKDFIKKRKGQLTEWEKIAANHIFDKDLVFKIYKEILQLNNKKKTIQSRNGQMV